MADWLLVLGAGASRPPPAGLPTFDELAAAILHALGWCEKKTDTGGKQEGEGSVWERLDRHGKALPNFPEIASPSMRMPPEVVFGTLHRFGVPFSRGLRDLLADTVPNAVHLVAANQLASGGPVWTTNVDRLIEEAYRRVPGFATDPPRYFRERLQGSEALRAHGELDARSLVKFHGTVEEPASLAFADLELLTPLSEVVVDLMVAVATGRRVVVHGYAGADLDLRAALRSAMESAYEVVWFEPDERNRQSIRRAFDGIDVNFLPPSVGADLAVARRVTGEAFLAEARDAGLAGEEISAQLAEMLTGVDVADWVRRPVAFSFESNPPAIVHARLVERFGRKVDESRALKLARREDARHVRVRVAPAYLRWSLSRSLYEDGLVAEGIRIYLRHPSWARIPAARRLRDFVLDKGTALLLVEGDWTSLDQLTEFALRIRHTPSGQPRPNDLYYRAHTLRYQMQPARARAAAAAAEAGLEGQSSERVDPERLVGAVLEQGILDLYQGRFEDALGRAMDLQTARGLFAIQRWPSWGYWLAGYAYAYRGDVVLSRRAFRRAREYFGSEPLRRAELDCLIGELFCCRVEVALGLADPVTTVPNEWEEMSLRQRDDTRLLLADHLLAAGDRTPAEHHLRTILAAPSNPVAEAWAELGMAEVRRLAGATNPGFAPVRESAKNVGARWLELQAMAGMLRAGEVSDLQVRTELLADTPQLTTAISIEKLSPGDPPVLWMVT